MDMDNHFWLWPLTNLRLSRDRLYVLRKHVKGFVFVNRKNFDLIGRMTKSSFKLLLQKFSKVGVIRPSRKRKAYPKRKRSLASQEKISLKKQELFLRNLELRRASRLKRELQSVARLRNEQSAPSSSKLEESPSEYRWTAERQSAFHQLLERDEATRRRDQDWSPSVTGTRPTIKAGMEKGGLTTLPRDSLGEIGTSSEAPTDRSLPITEQLSLPPPPPMPPGYLPNKTNILISQNNGPPRKAKIRPSRNKVHLCISGGMSQIPRQTCESCCTHAGVSPITLSQWEEEGHIYGLNRS